MPVPELTTFGALIRHALALEEFAVELYKGLEQSYQGNADLSRVFADLAAQHGARQKLLERTRREKLSEMILEPIEGLDGRLYVPKVHVTGAPGAAIQHGETAPDSETALAGKGGIAFARELEGICARFYLDSARAARMVLAEVSKVFERLAEDNRKNSDMIGG